MSYKKPVEQPRNQRAFVAIGFNDASTNFLAQFGNYDFDTLKECISDVTEYNAYKGASVAKAFEKIEDLVYSAYFGREGSPVLYLHLRPNEYINEQWVPKTPEQIADATKAIKKAFSRTHVDEFYQMNESDRNDDLTIRLWWD